MLSFISLLELAFHRTGCAPWMLFFYHYYSRTSHCDLVVWDFTSVKAPVLLWKYTLLRGHNSVQYYIGFKTVIVRLCLQFRSFITVLLTLYFSLSWMHVLMLHPMGWLYISITDIISLPFLVAFRARVRVKLSSENGCKILTFNLSETAVDHVLHCHVDSSEQLVQHTASSYFALKVFVFVDWPSHGRRRSSQSRTGVEWVFCLFALFSFSINQPTKQPVISSGVPFELLDGLAYYCSGRSACTNELAPINTPDTNPAAARPMYMHIHTHAHKSMEQQQQWLYRVMMVRSHCVHRSVACLSVCVCSRYGSGQVRSYTGRGW